MIEDLVELGADVATSSKNGGVILFFLVAIAIGVGLAFYFQSDFKQKCQTTCPADFKLMEEGSVCACKIKDQWVLKDLGK